MKHAATIIVLLSCALVLSACSTPQSSRISIEDYGEMGAKMADSLRQSEAFASRTKDSEPWLVSFDKVLNLSSEIMTQGEQWGVVSSVRDAQPLNTMWYDKRVVFVIPAQYAIDQRGTIDAERADKKFGSERKVTHVITATFRSLGPRATGDARTDSYQCEFKMISLKTNEPVWLDTFEFKRAARGSIRD